MSETTMDEWRNSFASDDVLTARIFEEDDRDPDIGGMLREYRTLLRALTLQDAGGQLDNAKLTSAIELARKFA